MTETRTAYAEMLAEKSIMYLPSCVIVEMMTKLYSEIFNVNQSGPRNESVPGILALLCEMRMNLRAASDAYGRPQFRLFSGDWKESKRRMLRLYYNIMSQLRCIAGMVGLEERGSLQLAAAHMAEEWIALDRAMDAKAEKEEGRSVLSRFRHPEPTWPQKMAKVILDLHEDAKYGAEGEEGEYLILLCFGKIKDTLVAAADNVHHRKGKSGVMEKSKKLDQSRILTVSPKKDASCNCGTCLEMKNSVGTRVLEKDYPKFITPDTIFKTRNEFCPLRSASGAAGAKSSDAKPRRPKKKHTTLQWIRAALGFRTLEPA